LNPWQFFGFFWFLCYLGAATAHVSIVTSLVNNVSNVASLVNNFFNGC
jgi:hypothetical protein